MRATTILIAAALLSGCDGGGESPAPVPPVQNPVENSAIVFIGDSITAGWPLDDYLPGAINAGISGNTTAQMLARFNTDVLPHAPAVVVILGGINDIRSGYVDSASLFALVQAAQAANAKVVVGTLTAADDAPHLEGPMIPELNYQIVRGAAAYGYAVVDYHAATVLPDGSLNPAMFPDHLHPNKAGYDAMWGALQPVLTTL